eukprot:TRINITY_DN6491_c0_g2_i1.p2 TRINITY_DN6491_c0_g2~~TRINITY_DN6491_c0_g2_i1.p2  ORF type:complete len:339 (-),score=48.36 TRINITY_DN6491_c0_g2_i1:27-1043(-)
MVGMTPSGRLFLWDIKSLTLLPHDDYKEKSVLLPHPATVVALSDDDFLISSSKKAKIRLCRLIKSTRYIEKMLNSSLIRSPGRDVSFMPLSIAVHPLTSDTYIACGMEKKILLFNSSLHFICDIRTIGQSVTLHSPEFLAFTNDGSRLLIYDSNTKVIYVASADRSTLLGTITISDSIRVYRYRICGLQLDSYDDIYVACHGSGEFAKLTLFGEPLHRSELATNQRGHLNTTYSFAIGEDDEIYRASQGSSEISVFSKDLVLLRNIVVPGYNIRYVARGVGGGLIVCANTQRIGQLSMLFLSNSGKILRDIYCKNQFCCTFDSFGRLFVAYKNEIREY